jgi:hypothetical protein
MEILVLHARFVYFDKQLTLVVVELFHVNYPPRALI